jgi:hypothetical protein
MVSIRIIKAPFLVDIINVVKRHMDMCDINNDFLQRVSCALRRSFFLYLAPPVPVVVLASGSAGIGAWNSIEHR